jgi:hypothetical protein
MLNIIKRAKKDINHNIEGVILLCKVFDNIFEYSILICNELSHALRIGFNDQLNRSIDINYKKYSHLYIIYDKNDKIKKFINYILLKYRDKKIIIFDWNNIILGLDDQSVNILLIKNINYIISKLFYIDKSTISKFITDTIKTVCDFSNMESSLFYNVLNNLFDTPNEEIIDFKMIISSVKNLMLRTPFENETRYSIISKLSKIDNLIVQNIKISKVDADQQEIFIIPLSSNLEINFKLMLLYIILYYIYFMKDEIIFILNIPTLIINHIEKYNLQIYDMLNTVLKMKNIILFYITDDIVKLDLLRYFNIMLISYDSYMDLHNKIIEILSEDTLKKIKLKNLIPKTDEFLLIINLNYVYIIKLFGINNCNKDDNYILFI